MIITLEWVALFLTVGVKQRQPRLDTDGLRSYALSSGFPRLLARPGSLASGTAIAGKRAPGGVTWTRWQRWRKPASSEDPGRA